MSVPAAASDPLPQPAWGSLIAVYFILIGLPSGITLVSWWLRERAVAGGIGVERYGHWTSLAAMVLLSLILVADLGRPERFYLMLTRFGDLGSPIAIGAKLVALKTFLLIVVLYSLERRRKPLEQGGTRSASDAPPRGSLEARAGAALPWLLVLASLALAVYPAAVLARSWASPLAATSGASLIFVLTALLMGAAAMVLIGNVLGTSEHRPELLRAGHRAMLVLLVLLGTAFAFEALSLGGDPPDRRILADLTTGGFASTFWGLVVVVGIAVPAVGLSLSPNRRAVSVASAAAVMTGAAATRYLMFTAGQ